jgi:CheY-like chemotaxis protein
LIDSPSILVVDDEPLNRSISTGVLAAAGWIVDGVESGEAAIAALRQRRYDLVLMDIQMPGMDGFATARAIRSGDMANRRAPILAFTTIPPGDTIERARAAGMDGHIAKPFTPEALLAAVAPWHPGDEGRPAASLVSIFGEEEIGRLLDRFRDQLVEALEAEEDIPARRARAHKIAGVSGTLGFADVSRTWLAVSEGDESAWSEARIAARQALARIDRHARQA